VTAERALLARLEGGCQVPVGALAVGAGGELVLSALVADLDGRDQVRATEAAKVASEDEARALGERVAERLLAGGAREVLDRIRAAAPALLPRMEP
jgi:hydroxymethylbilane synthase